MDRLLSLLMKWVSPQPRCGACAEFICGNWFRNSCNIFLLAKFILKLKLYRGIFQYLHHPSSHEISSQACKVVNYCASGWPSVLCAINAKQALINFNTEDEFVGVHPLSFALLYVYCKLKCCEVNESTSFRFSDFHTLLLKLGWVCVLLKEDEVLISVDAAGPGAGGGGPVLESPGRGSNTPLSRDESAELWGPGAVSSVMVRAWWWYTDTRHSR